VTTFRDRTLRFALGSSVPRLAYRHLFISNGSIDSMLHVQNPFSFFDPHGHHRALVAIETFDADGTLIGSFDQELAPFASLAKPVVEVVGNRCASGFGSVTIDILPPPKFRDYLRRSTDKIPRIASPFWVRFWDDSGSQAFVHSIEADLTKFRGVAWPLSRVLIRKPTQARRESDRTISVGEDMSVEAFVVNHSRTTLTTDCQWVSLDRGIESESRIQIEPRGTSLVSLPEEITGNIFLRLSRLSTPNAKPYVIVRNHEGLFGLTHG